jgi:hypothetical protein
MLSDSQATVAVQYRFIDGYHVFTSHEVYGLYVASKDPNKAYHDVGPAIEQLLKLNEGVECSVEPAFCLREFIKVVRGQAPEAWQLQRLSSRRFVLRPAA